MAGAAHGADELFPVVPVYLVPEIVYVDVRHVGVHLRLFVVDVLDYVGAADDVAPSVGQELEERVLLGRERHGFARPLHLMARRVDLEVGDPYNGLLHSGLAPQERPYPGKELVEDKGLGEVVVGPGVEALYLVKERVAGGKENDRRCYAFFPQPLEYLDPVHKGQHDIEDYGVDRIGLGHVETLFPVMGHVNGVSRLFKTLLYYAGKVLFVFNKEYPHLPITPGPRISGGISGRLSSMRKGPSSPSPHVSQGPEDGPLCRST